MLVFEEGRKPENPAKKPWEQVRTNNKPNPHVAPGWKYQARATLLGRELFYHYIIPATQNYK